MKTLILTIILLFAFASINLSEGSPKPIKRMTQAQVKRATKGITMYTHYNGKVYKNTMKIRQLKLQNKR